MKFIKSFWVFTAIIVIAVAGCKKDKEDAPIDQFANTFLVEEITLDNITGDTIRHNYYRYDSLNRIYKFDDLNLYYNTDGTLNKIVEVYGDSVNYYYDGSKRLIRAISFNYPVTIPDTIDFFYSNSVKPDSITYSYLSATLEYIYGQNGMAETTILKSDQLYDATTVSTWQNGNMLEQLTSTDEPDVYYSNVYEYDSKTNYAKTMHLTKEFLFTVEFGATLGFYSKLLMENNIVKYTFHDNYNNVTNAYKYTMIEYNEKGLPVRIEEDNWIKVLVYEER